MSGAEWRELHRIAQARDSFIISDEACGDYVPDPGDFVSAAVHDPARAHTTACNSLSKNYGISGWRIG